MIFYVKGGDNVGRIMIIEFKDSNDNMFDEIIQVLKNHLNIDFIRLNGESKLTLCGLELFPERKTAYYNNEQLSLTTKEFDVLWVLTVYKNRILSYSQIYRNVWGEEAIGNVNNMIACHVRGLRKKLSITDFYNKLSIRCVRGVGYSLEIKEQCQMAAGGI